MMGLEYNRSGFLNSFDKNQKQKNNFKN